ncbi:MAG: SpoIVB peptidase [Clostridiales bacterium]|nr:SpoIVB peptidase [Clostridiales bacterium]
MNVNLKKKFCIFTLIVLIVLSAITVFAVNQTNYINGETISVDSNNISRIQLNSAIQSEETAEVVNFKLFGIIPIGKVQIDTQPEKYVNLGGYPIGIAIKTGLYITSKVSVVTKDGAVCPVDGIEIQSGDVLLSIDGVKLDSVNQINALIQDKEQVSISIKHKNGTMDYTVTPALDILSGKNKLGLLLQDQIEGIGTMTYTDGDKFYALGHAIKDINGDDVSASGGNIFNANIVGYVKGQKGKAGELSGSFSTLSNSLGSITANNIYGMYGNLNKNSESEKILLGSKADAQPGTAYIYTTIDGIAPQKYEIQIIKTNSQSSPAEKSMVLRVTDQRLLDTTGGIVQGMSGSPIIQNGKLIGAVTHVFVSDPTKGYGVYVDWMQP